jgi:hypothetical protein
MMTKTRVYLKIPSGFDKDSLLNQKLVRFLNLLSSFSNKPVQ